MVSLPKILRKQFKLNLKVEDTSPKKQYCNYKTVKIIWWFIIIIEFFKSKKYICLNILLWKNTTLIRFVLFIFVCGVKNTQNLLTEGDYNAGLTVLSRVLIKREKQARLCISLRRSFAKARERSKFDTFWEQEANPQNLEKIYTTYAAWIVVRSNHPIAFTISKRKQERKVCLQ
jgi:hypothetical protein